MLKAPEIIVLSAQGANVLLLSDQVTRSGWLASSAANLALSFLDMVVSPFWN